MGTTQHKREKPKSGKFSAQIPDKSFTRIKKLIVV